jgi:invasion protein IalB
MQIEWRIASAILAAAALCASGASAQAPASGAAASAPAAGAQAPASQEGVGAWRVECGGDGKVLECRAFQQLLTRENQLVAQVVARLGPDKQPQLAMQLPLGISVSEPVVIKVDNGKEEKAPLQTCTNTGCFVSIPLKDPLLASMRTGTQLKLALQDTNKRTLNIDVPLLGFALAFDKATK